MTIEFVKSTYYHRAEDQEILDEPKSSLHIQYGNVTYVDFAESQKLTDAQKSDLRIMAIPGVFIGLINCIYHLAKAAFSIPSLLCGDTAHLKVQVLNVGRDLQQIFGRAYSLYDPSYGGFHVEEAAFQKTCYEVFLYNHTRQELLNEYEEIKKASVFGSAKNYKYLDLAERFVSLGDPKSALKVTNEIFGESDRTKDLYIKIAEAYLKEGNNEKALEVAKKIFGESKATVGLFVKIAESYLKNDDYKSAFETQKKIYWDVTQKVDFCVKIHANALKMGDMSFAMTVTQYMMSDACRMTLATAFVNAHTL